MGVTDKHFLCKNLVQCNKTSYNHLCNIPGTRVYRNVAHYLEATRVPGILIISIDTAIYFSNSAYIHDKILMYFEDKKQRLEKTGGAKVHYLILDLACKIHIDHNILLYYWLILILIFEVIILQLWSSLYYTLWVRWIVPC